MNKTLLDLLKFLKEDYKKITEDMFSLQGEAMAKTVGRISLLCIVIEYLEDKLAEKPTSNTIGFTTTKNDNEGDADNG